MGSFSKKIARFATIFIDQNGYVKVLEGLKNTLLIAVSGLVIGILIGILIAGVRVMPKYKRLPRILNSICSVYVAFFRGTPMVVQLLLFYYVLFPLLGINITGVQISMIVFGLNSGAYVAEIVRGGIMAVDNGQFEAGRSLGFNYFATMRHIILPQAFKNILPALGNEFIVLLKETSVAGYIGVADLTKGGDIITSNTYNAFLPLIAVALIYLVMVLGLQALVGKLERRLRKSDH